MAKKIFIRRNCFVRGINCDACHDESRTLSERKVRIPQFRDGRSLCKKCGRGDFWPGLSGLGPFLWDWPLERTGPWRKLPYWLVERIHRAKGEGPEFHHCTALCSWPVTMGTHYSLPQCDIHNYSTLCVCVCVWGREGVCVFVCALRLPDRWCGFLWKNSFLNRKQEGILCFVCVMLGGSIKERRLC